MKKLFFLMMLLLPVWCVAQNARGVDKRYLAGAVPLVDGYVQFDRSFKVNNSTKTSIMDSLRSYVQRELVDGEEQLPQARLTEVNADSGIIAASIEEYMYFKRTNWQIHRVRFYYQLVLNVTNDGFTATMRRLHYRYDPEVTAGEFDEDRRAENWITDEAALSKDGKKLQRISGKFRKFTIDRKNEIFKGLALAAGAKSKRKVKVVEVEEDEDED